MGTGWQIFICFGLKGIFLVLVLDQSCRLQTAVSSSPQVEPPY